jgi:DUF218 domain
MTLILLVVIVVIASLCVMLKWSRSGFMLLGVAIVLFIAVGCGPIPSWMLGHLQSFKAGNRKSNGSPAMSSFYWTLEWRAQKARRSSSRACFRTGASPRRRSFTSRCAAVTCKVVVTGGDARNTGASEAAVYGNALTRLGVNPADIVLETKSMNTSQNAQFTSNVLRTLYVDQILIVSSNYQLHRSALYSAHFRIDIKLVRADYLAAVPSMLPLAYNFAVADLALHEYLGIVRYDIYNALGWNCARAASGQV